MIYDWNQLDHVLVESDECCFLCGEIRHMELKVCNHCLSIGKTEYKKRDGFNHPIVKVINAMDSYNKYEAYYFSAMRDFASCMWGDIKQKAKDSFRSAMYYKESYENAFNFLHDDNAVDMARVIALNSKLSKHIANTKKFMSKNEIQDLLPIPNSVFTKYNKDNNDHLNRNGRGNSISYSKHEFEILYKMHYGIAYTKAIK